MDSKGGKEIFKVGRFVIFLKGEWSFGKGLHVRGITWITIRGGLLFVHEVSSFEVVGFGSSSLGTFTEGGKSFLGFKFPAVCLGLSLFCCLSHGPNLSDSF